MQRLMNMERKTNLGKQPLLSTFMEDDEEQAEVKDGINCDFAMPIRGVPSARRPAVMIGSGSRGGEGRGPDPTPSLSPLAFRNVAMILRTSMLSRLCVRQSSSELRRCHMAIGSSFPVAAPRPSSPCRPQNVCSSRAPGLN